MPPVPKKNASIILYDVSCQPKFRDGAKNCLTNIFASKWFSESKDCTKLILVNTKDSDNELHRKFGQAQHISEVTDVVRYDPHLINSHLEDVETAEGDWIVALAIAIEEIKNNYVEEKGAMTLQILLVTDFSGNKSELKEKRVNFIITSINTLNIFLYIVGPEVKVPTQMSSMNDVHRWAKHIEFVNDSNDPQLKIVKKIVENTKNSIVCSLELGQQLFLSYRNYWGLQPWFVPLTIGKNIAFPAVTTRFLRAAKPPRIKPQNVEQTPWSWHAIDDIMVEVPHDNVIGGVAKHGKFIPLPLDVEKNFKYFGDRGLKVVGFTDRCNISQFYMCGEGSFYVQSDSRSFNLLLCTLAKKNLCVIARKIYYKNCKPKLVALLPEQEENAFILVELPYQENVRIKISEQDVQEVPTLDTVSVKRVYEYLTLLDVTKSENMDQTVSKFPLASSLMAPIRLNEIHKFLSKKYMGEAVDIGENKPIPVSDIPASYLHLCPSRPVVH